MNDKDTVVDAYAARRDAVMRGLASFCECTPDFDMSAGLRRSAAEHILGMVDLAAAPSTSVREEAITAAITAAIAKADEDFGYRFNLTRLVDGEETHTLFMDGFEPVEFDDRDDGYRLIAERRNKARATAVLAALVPSTDEGKRHG